jgi:RND family efflux transporter MFP subunit
MYGFRQPGAGWLAFLSVALLAELLASCNSQSASGKVTLPSQANVPEVGVVKVTRANLRQSLTVSSELVPFQQIDVYAKESGFVSQLNVDYGTHVRTGQVMAVLEIPELGAQLEEDQAAIKDAEEEVSRYQENLNQVQAQQNVTHLEYTRINGVAQSKPGLVAQQEVDDWQGKDLAASSQVAGSRSSLQAAKSRLDGVKARLRHDQALFDYSKITAPFDGVVTKRYANLGTLMQTGVNSSVQVLPLVQLSQDSLFRLVIPVPESYVPRIKVGDPVKIRVDCLDRSFPGRVTRLSVDVERQTRTMHTEVDVPNPQQLLMPGMYADATLTIARAKDAIAVPPEAVNIEGDERSVWVVDPSGTVEHRLITTGVETPNQIEVTSGLQVGEMVAAGNRSRLHAGEKVRPKIIQLLHYEGK